MGYPSTPIIVISMAKKQQMQAPSGMAGLVRYYEEDKAIIKLKPEHVLIICSVLAALELALVYLF